MKRLIRKCKRAFVLVLTVALICNSLEFTTLRAVAENSLQTDAVLSEVSSTVSDNVAFVENANDEITVTDGNSEEQIPESGSFKLEEYEGVFVLPPTETSAISVSMFSLRNGTVDKISGNAVKWYDRLDLSGDELQCVRDFYANLIEWSDNDGTEDYLIDDAYFTDGENVQKMVTVSLTGTDLGETAQAVYEELLLYIPYMRAVLDAFDRDYPEVFWLSGTMAYDFGNGVSYTLVNGEYQCTASLYLVVKDLVDFNDGNGETDYDMRDPAYQPAGTLDAAIAARDAAVAQILTEEVKNMEPAKQIEDFNDILTKTNQYNTIVGNGVAGTAPLDSWECISALTGRTGTEGPVCEGYARALKVLCDEVGIPCVLVDGNAIAGGSAGPHMWNYVQLDGNWYAMDVTWNDPVYTADNQAISGGETKMWSLLGSDTVVNDMKFIESHPVSNTASPGGVSFTNGPVLSAEKYSNNVAIVRSSSGTEVMYENIVDALNAAGTANGSTLILLKDVILSQEYQMTGMFTLDLNGYTMNLGNNTLIISKTAEFTVKDTSAGGDGKVTGSATITFLIYGTFRLMSGTIENTAEIEGMAINNMGEAVITGGTINATADIAHAIWNVSNAVLTLNGGKLQVAGEYNEGVFVQNGSTFILSGEPIVEASVAFCIDNAARILIMGALTGEEVYKVKYYADENGYYGFFAQAESTEQATAVKNRFVSVEDGLDVFADGSALGMDYRKGDMDVSIVWDDLDNRYNTRPIYIQVDIYENGEFKEIITIIEEEGWKYTLENVYLYNADGAIEYEMVLNDIDNIYIGTPGPSEDGYVIIASLAHKHDLKLAYYVQGDEEYYSRVVVNCAEEEGSCDWDGEHYSLTVTGPDNWPIVYDGEAKTATITDSITTDFPNASVSEIAYYKKDGNQWIAVTEAVDAGVYKAEVIVTLDGSTKAVWKEFEISKKSSSTLCDVQGINRVFDPWATEGVEAVKVTLEVEGAVAEYSTDGGSTWSTTVPMMKEVGSLDVKVRVSAPNYETYEESITASLTPYDISCDIAVLEEEEYYYTGAEVRPLLEGLRDSMGRMLPLTAEEYALSYSNNVERGLGDIYVTPTNPNYTGGLSGDFRIAYYPIPENILYNGGTTKEPFYTEDVVVSVEGYTIRKDGDTSFQDMITVSGEGLWLREPVQFKQNGTGYITNTYEVVVSIDRTAPTFEAEDCGIYLKDYCWQTLATEIVYNVSYGKGDILKVSAEDNLPVYIEVYYYVDATGSTTALTKAQLDALRDAEKFVLSTNGEIALEDDGKYVVYAYAVDEAGYLSDYVSTNGIVRDTKAPEVVVMEPTEEAGTLKDTEMTFKVTADEDAMIGIYMLSDYSGESAGVLAFDDSYDFWEEVDLGEDHTVYDGGVEITYKVFANAGETKTITITGLNPNTFYEYSVEVYDKAENGTVIAGERVEDSRYAYYMKGITTLKTAPIFAADPTIIGIYGQKLSEMTLSQPVSTNNVPGSWSIVYTDDSQKDAVLKVGTTNSYQVKFTPSGENAEDYESVTVQVVPTVAKKAVTATIENVTITYGDDIPEFSYVTTGVLAGEEVTMSLSSTAVNGSDSGTYTITGTCDSDNYAVTIVNGTLTIKQAQGTITVASGKDVYDKTFGDDSFTLSGITSNNSEGQLRFAVSGDAVSVDAAGKVTIKGAGSAVITVSMAETKNYKAAEAVEITVNVAKASTTDQTLEKCYLYLREASESIDLSSYVATDAGNITYTVGTVNGDCEFAVAPTVVNGRLTYTVKAGEIDDSASFAVSVSSDNYEDFDIQVTLKLVDKTPIEGEVSLKENTLTYGEALSKLEFEDIVFVAEGTDEEVAGTISWVNPDYKPDVATTKATWIFTPDSSEYMGVTGEIAIVVEKADYPEITVVPVKPTVYGEFGYLSVDSELEDSEMTMTVPENNGVVKEIRATESGFEVEALNAGTVIVTVVAHDTTGNYKDGMTTYELTVAPATLKAEWIGWAEGVNGEETYTGEALIPNVVVKKESVTLVQGEDFTVEYSNNTDAYEYVPGQEGFETAAAPVATIIGKGNYAGEASLFFVIKRAENAPNAPATEKKVANHVTKASQISLPEGWIWQNPDQELLADGANEVVAVYNGADKDNYVNITAIVSVTRLEAGIPFVEEINGTEVQEIEAGWNHVKEDLQNAQEGDTVVVNMNGVTILPGEVLEEIKDKDIAVVLDMGNDVEWHINGKSITAEEIPDVDLGVEVGTANIPVNIMNTITGEISTIQISLAYSGDFGYEAVLRIGLGAENAGYYAQLFYFENEASLSYIQEDVIDAEGYAELPFVHASDYVIVIDDTAYQTPGSSSGSGSGSGNSGNGAGSGNSTTPAPTPVPTPIPVVPQVPTSPNTGDTSAEPVVGMAVLFMMAALTVEYRRRKSNGR